MLKLNIKRLITKEVSPMEHKEKRVLEPMVGVAHNDDDTGFYVEIDLAGASKNTVELDMGKNGFCITAEGDDFKYESCYTFAHEVKPDEAKAKFESGLLSIDVPLRNNPRLQSNCR